MIGSKTWNGIAYTKYEVQNADFNVFLIVFPHDTDYNQGVIRGFKVHG